MTFSVFGLLAMGNQPTEYIAIAHCRHSFQGMPFVWAVFFGWPISCKTSQHSMAWPSAFILSFKSESVAVTQIL